jgi:hypothetical protein
MLVSLPEPASLHHWRLFRQLGLRRPSLPTFSTLVLESEMSWISASVIVSVVKPFSPSCRRGGIAVSVALLDIQEGQK